jgi:NADP-dependent 3-hydroxy acid dehydrogenase YdfG
MKPESKMEPEETYNEPSLDKMLDLNNPAVLKGLGALVEELKAQKAAALAKASDKKQ